MICLKGEAAVSGSFWTKPGLELAIRTSDQLIGDNRRKKLNEIEESVINGAAYLPVWLVKPRAWVQNHLTKPLFDGSGQLLLDLLGEIK